MAAPKVIQQLLDWVDTSRALLALTIRVVRDALSGEMPVLAAGTALYAILAMIPTLAAAVGVYSLIADPKRISHHLATLADVLPPAVAEFISNELTRQAERSQRELGLAVATSALLAIWSARGAAAGLIDTLNRAYRIHEQRGRLVKFALTLAISASNLIGVMLFFAAVVALPGVLRMTRVDTFDFITWLRWPVMFSVVFLSLLLLYRFAPSRWSHPRLHLWPGAFVATGLLFGVSLALSFWVSKVTDYNVFYGTFGSVIVTILWFYFSTLSIVLGACANAELERRDAAPDDGPVAPVGPAAPIA